MSEELSPVTKCSILLRGLVQTSYLWKNWRHYDVWGVLDIKRLAFVLHCKAIEATSLLDVRGSRETGINS